MMMMMMMIRHLIQTITKNLAKNSVNATREKNVNAQEATNKFKTNMK